VRTANTAILTVIALVAFAANSVLCRLALGSGLIDAASFTAIRVISGAVVLGLIILLRRNQRRAASDWRAGLALFAYMITFSFAYLSLDVGTGALIAFGAVQLTMFIVAIRGGEQFSLRSWLGLAIAISGLVYLVAPGVTSPDPRGAALMIVAGVAWGAYSLLGRSAAEPTWATAANFFFSVPLVVLTSLLFIEDFDVSTKGVLLAVASGAAASGLGYTIWYAALRGHTATSAATVQLSAPVIAALGGVVLLAEDLTLRLAISSIATLGGVAIVLLQRKPATDQSLSIER